MTVRKYLADGSINPKYRPGSSGKSGKSGKVLSAFDKAIFCAWDGEGAKINGKHEYILLANSNGQEISNPEGLSTLDCLNFLVRGCANLDRRTIHVWFVMSYDVNMILRDVPKESITLLWKGGDIDYGCYNIRYKHRKELVIRLFDPKDKWQQVNDKWQRKWLYKVHMWDVFGYFQTRFTQAIREWYGSDFSKEELENLESNKANRSAFTVDQLPDITAYCKQELSALVLLCQRLQQYLTTANLPVSRWDGAGSIAASLLRRERIKEHMRDHDPVIEKLFSYAYAGGRIELIQYGYHDKGIYTYDINSAYPHAMTKLPSFKGGRWVYSKQFVPDTFGIWRVDYDNEEHQYFPIHPLFYRDKRGMIYYPFRTSGYFWTPEVENAVFMFPQHTKVIEGWYWLSSESETPFAFIPDLYKLRKEWKAQKIGAQIVIKLGLNSLYGKMAQQVGGHDGKRPPFHNLAWAGYITSQTRARLFRAAMQSPYSIIFLATDGIASTVPLDLECGDSLGDWETGKQEALLAVQSGVYWYWRNKDNEPKAYYRGFDKGQLSPDIILEAYRLGLSTIQATSTRFVGMGTALTGDRWDQWRTWPSVPRTLRLRPDGTKRYDHWESVRWSKNDNPSRRLFRTIPTPLYQGANGGMTHPYPIKWLGEDWEEQYLDGIRASAYEAEWDDSYS